MEMKKIFSLLIAIVVVASAFSFSASKAQAAGLITFADGRFIWGKGIVFQFDASEVKNKDLKAPTSLRAQTIIRCIVPTTMIQRRLSV